MKVLIMDDEQLDLFVAKKLLSLEHQVEGFSTHKDALTWAANNTFDVALIDYYMESGLKPDQILKDLINLKGNTFKAFVLSSFVDDKQIKELKSAGFIDVISKPITLDAFKKYTQS